VNEFCYRARVFLSEARNHGMRGVIALHCTHGFNRTGAMAVHLKQRLGWPDAMKVRLLVFFLSLSSHLFQIWINHTVSLFTAVYN
jgi:hypothetical protein